MYRAVRTVVSSNPVCKASSTVPTIHGLTPCLSNQPNSFLCKSAYLASSSSPCCVRTDSANVHLDVSLQTMTMEPKPGDFCVYAATSHAGLPTLITTLNRGQFENPPSQTQWSPPQNLQKTTRFLHWVCPRRSPSSAPRDSRRGILRSL